MQQENPEVQDLGVEENVIEQTDPPIINLTTLENVMEQEKDYFWAYIGAIIVAVAAVLWMVKSSEHGKYVTAAKAIAEDTANSAYKHSPP